MTLWYKGHHYRSQIGHNFKSMLWLDSYKGWKWRYRNLTWFGHQDDCCDYWTPVHLSDGSIDPAVKRAFILDDELGLNQPIKQEDKDNG